MFHFSFACNRLVIMCRAHQFQCIWRIFSGITGDYQHLQTAHPRFVYFKTQSRRYFRIIMGVKPSFSFTLQNLSSIDFENYLFILGFQLHHFKSQIIVLFAFNVLGFYFTRKNSAPLWQTNDENFILSLQVYSLMSKCWAYNYEERPCFSILENQLKSLMQEKRDNGHDY